jgi:hypothetical protein
VVASQAIGGPNQNIQKNSLGNSLYRDIGLSQLLLSFFQQSICHPLGPSMSEIPSRGAGPTDQIKYLSWITFTINKFAAIPNPTEIINIIKKVIFTRYFLFIIAKQDPRYAPKKLMERKVHTNALV